MLDDEETDRARQVSERDWFGDDAEATGQGNGAGGAGRTATRERRRSPLVTTLLILVVVGIAASLIAQFWTEVLWFDSVSFRSVFLTELGAKVLLGVVGGLITAGIVGSSLYIAYRTRPIYAPTSTNQDALERYRAAVEPLRRIAMIGIPLVIGLLSGLGAAGQWETFLLWRNAQTFGKTDPQFGLDVGFYVFTLPWLTFVVAFLSMALIIGVIVAAFTHYIFGGLQFQARARRTTSAARLHLSILLAAIVLVRAASYWLERYSLTTKSTDLMTGIQYTDANAVLPTKAILAIASIMCAVMFLSVIWTRSWRLPIVGVVLLLVVSIVVGGIFPALIQSLRVRPSEKSFEAPYIQNNINATRDAFGLSGVQTTAYNAATTATQGQLRNDTTTVPGIRILDPNVVSATYKQLQAGKSYYQFPDTLDVDRYTVDGLLRDTVIAVREIDLDGVPDGQRNWLNDHTVYTHGYGLVAAYGNRKDADGKPVFFEQNIPSTGSLGVFQPRVYFGEQSPAYSIVGAPAGASPREFDYPDASPAGQANTTYTGQGGVPIGGLPVKIAYAIKYREMNFLLSDAVNSDSRLLDHRTPRDRVARVAPWLTLDGNAYPAVVNGKVLWIVDGYTTTADYPNSHLTSIDQATSDSITSTRQSVQSIAAGQVNYMRNSVKATVDAYDGTVNLYAWDESDPMLKAWMGAFPDTVKPMSDISGDLMAHLRYPEDLFKVQREILARYHVTDPGTFYGSNDLWRVPSDPTRDQRTPVDQPPYYLSIAMPGQNEPNFSLTTTFMPFGTREVLSGFLAVDSNAGTTAGQRRAGYGELRLLELPKDSNVRGPGQVQNDISSSSVQPPEGGLGLSQFLNIQKQQGSSVVLGNLLTLPVGGGLLYVEPIYVQANTQSAYPLNRAIVVAFGDKLAWSSTLDGALDALFGGNSGAKSGDNTPTTGGTGPTPTPPPAGTTPPADNPALTKALADAQQAVNDADAALKAGDFAKYGEAQTRLKAAIAAAAAAAPTGTATLTPGATPTSTATASPSTTPAG
jgi:uncharacterized protein